MIMEYCFKTALNYEIIVIFSLIFNFNYFKCKLIMDSSLFSFYWMKFILSVLIDKIREISIMPSDVANVL